MSATDAQIDWLNERFPYDKAARNAEVEKSFVHHFRNHEKINIVDVNSGTGANCLYFMERLFKNQAWTLIEKDAVLCGITKNRIERFLQDYNFFYTFEQNVFRIKVWESRVKITILNATFSELETIVDLREIDVIMTTAGLGLLPNIQFDKMAETILDAKLTLFATMNYQALRFDPKENSDAGFIMAYENYLRRKLSTEVGALPNNLEILESFFKNKNLKYIKGKSQWNLDAKAEKMHQFLLNFMEDAVNETNHSGTDPKPFYQWILNKRNLSNAGELKIEADHFDFFGGF